MNDDRPLSDLEERLRAWRPADLPAELRTRLRSAGPTPRREVVRWLQPTLAAACVLAVGVALLLAVRFAPTKPSGNDSAAATPSAPPRVNATEPAAESRRLFGGSLTMNIYTGVPPGTVPAGLRLDGDFVGSSGLIPVRSTDGILPLKVDCQF